MIISENDPKAALKTPTRLTTQDSSSSPSDITITPAADAESSSHTNHEQSDSGPPPAYHDTGYQLPPATQQYTQTTPLLSPTNDSRSYGEPQAPDDKPRKDGTKMRFFKAFVVA